MSSIVHLKLDDPAAQARIANAMRAEGVDPLNTSAFCSSVHTAAPTWSVRSRVRPRDRRRVKRRR